MGIEMWSDLRHKLHIQKFSFLEAADGKEEWAWSLSQELKRWILAWLTFLWLLADLSTDLESLADLVL